MPQFFHFEPSARLQKYLGSQLIADPNLAVVELVKNSYDAGATQVFIDLTIESLPKESQILTVSDNGTGMNRDSFEENWMRPGFSYKASDSPVSAPETSSPAGAIREGRVPIGEKGLGRLAAARLGDLLDVYTRETSGDPWLHVAFDWAQFEDMEKPLRDVAVEYDFETTPGELRFASGTVVEIRRLTLDWKGLVPGRKVPWRPDSRLGRLKQDLGILVGPLPLGSEFEVVIASDSRRYQGLMGPVQAGGLDSPDYQYKFSVAETESEIVVEKSLQRSPAIVDRVEAESESRWSERWRKEVSGDTDGRPTTLRCGPFRGTFIYSPLAGRRRAELGRPPGVFMYRDGMRIDPYGHGDDDWLGARAKKASRQGYAAIQPNLLYGFVEITREHNPRLVDMSNRQGLVENDEYEDFIAHARAEFRSFEKLVFEEWVQPQWEQPESKAQRQAERTQAFGVVIARALLHSIGQPVAGLDAEMATLRHVAESRQLPAAVADKLRGIEKRVMGHLTTIRTIVQTAMSMGEEDYSKAEAVQLNQVVEEAVRMTEALASSLNVAIQFLPGGEQKVIVPRRALFEALSELIRNGIEAQRPAGRLDRWVKVETRRQERACSILVSDNGTGIDESLRAQLGETAFSTKGRPGVGLIRVRELLALCGASFVAKSSTEGTTFEVTVRAGLAVGA